MKRGTAVGVMLVSAVFALAGCTRSIDHVVAQPMPHPTGGTASTGTPAEPNTPSGSAVPPGSAAPSSAAPSRSTSASPAAPSVPVASATPPPSTTATPSDTVVQGLRPGSSGPAVQALQERLRDLHYDPGPIDGRYGAATGFAVDALQKVNDLPVTGIADDKTLAALANPRTPTALVPDGGADRVEVDLTKQLLTVYADGEPVLISHISTGSGKTYCVEDDCSRAVTPKGDFKTTWRVDGWRTSRLGQLYRPVYFNGGIAVHGYPSVPLHPASHGCVRIPMHTAEVFPGLVGTGEPVYVR